MLLRVEGVSEGGVGSAAHTKHYDVIWGNTIRVCRGVGTEKRFREARESKRDGSFDWERYSRTQVVPGLVPCLVP